RHAGSWGITCQACAEDTTCSACDAFAHLPVSDSVKKTLEAQSHLEGDTPKRHVLVGWTSHFYVAVDLPRLKIVTQAGSPRIAEQHELVHLFLERAERAYEDLDAAFGGDIRQDKPMGILLCEHKQ